MKVFSDSSVMWREWIDTVEDCLKKRGLDVRQARGMLHDRSVSREVVRGNM